MGKGKDGGMECCLFCGGIVFCVIVTVVVIGLIGLGIAKICMGSIYLHECSIQSMIPVYLIVSGVVPLLFSGSGRSDSDGRRSYGVGDLCGLLAFLFQVSWLICGTVWVYPNYGKINAPDYVPCPANGTTHCTKGTCDKTFLTFAFAMVTIDWVFFSLGITVVDCMIFNACRAK